MKPFSHWTKRLGLLACIAVGLQTGGEVHGEGFANSGSGSNGTGSSGRYTSQPSPSDYLPASVRLDSDADWMQGHNDLTGTDDLLGTDAPIGSSVVPFGAASVGHTHACTCGSCGQETPLTRFRKSAYQGSSLSFGTLGGNGENLTHYRVETRFALPLDGMDNVLIAAPSFRQDILDYGGPVDTPENLYNVGVNFTWMKKLSDRWRLLAMVTPGVRSDFQTSENAFRLFGLGTATYSWVPNKLDVTLGAVYLDRDDIPLLPVIGFNWTPAPWWKIEMNFPRPRIARRIDKQGACSETWVYTGVALGGNTWAVERANGADDELTLRDYRWVLGWEHLRSGGRGLFFETGAAFGRVIEYESDGIERDLDDALFFRGGITL